MHALQYPKKVTSVKQRVSKISLQKHYRNVSDISSTHNNLKVILRQNYSDYVQFVCGVSRNPTANRHLSPPSQTLARRFSTHMATVPKYHLQTFTRQWKRRRVTYRRMSKAAPVSRAITDKSLVESCTVTAHTRTAYYVILATTGAAAAKRQKQNGRKVVITEIYDIAPTWRPVRRARVNARISRQWTVILYALSDCFMRSHHRFGHATPSSRCFVSIKRRPKYLPAESRTFCCACNIRSASASWKAETEATKTRKKATARGRGRVRNYSHPRRALREWTEHGECNRSLSVIDTVYF